MKYTENDQFKDILESQGILKGNNQFETINKMNKSDNDIELQKVSTARKLLSDPQSEAVSFVKGKPIEDYRISSQERTKTGKF